MESGFAVSEDQYNKSWRQEKNACRDSKDHTELCWPMNVKSSRGKWVKINKESVIRCVPEMWA